jgi:flagellar motor switch protein FliN
LISNSELITKLGGLQSQIWGTVSMIVSESANQMINFADALTVSTNTSELASELNTPMLVISFSFAGASDRAQVVLLKQDTFAGIAGLIKGEEADEVDDNLVVDVRPQLEAVVQGLCLAVGNLRDEPIVASGISIRYQIFQFPQNLQRAELLARTQVAISAGDVQGAAIWLMDGDTMEYITGDDGTAATAEDEESPFLQVQNGGGNVGTHAITGGHPQDDGSLGILLDIPLEISVELGRVKMVVRDILELGNGSIIEIDKAAGEPVDVMVNGRLVARGEVVVIEDNFGVRITEICNAMERLMRLGEAA